MNIIDLRNKLQQSSTEQSISSDRRRVFYQFGSPEWLEYMKKNQLKYLEQEERRNIIRRREERKTSDASEINDSETTVRRIFLTPAERRLLQDIYLSDLD